MKKSLHLFLALMISSLAFANAGMRFEKLTWAQVKAKAAKEKKMIFFDAYTTWCGPCKFLDEKVYTDASVADYFNSNYINVKFDMEDGEGIDLAGEFDITSYPTLLFFDASGKLVHKYIGAMKAPEFIQLGKDAMDPSKQYFTLKNKVEDRKATTADFVKWTEMAEELEDGNRGAVASSWLSDQEDILGNAELAKAALLYSDVTEEQLAYLYNNQARIASLLGWDADKVAATLYRKLFSLALTSMEDNTRGAADFSAIIKKFDKSKIAYADIDLAILKAMYEDQDLEKAADILVRSIAPAGKLNIRDFANLLIDYSPRFENDQAARIGTALENYKIQAADKGVECWYQIALVICYSKSGEIEKAKAAARLAVVHPNIPAQYKQILTESFDL
jgi:thiol-disulfide isomerase/thioredoxin